MWQRAAVSGFETLFRNLPGGNEKNQWRAQEFCSEGNQQIQLRTEDRDNGDLGAAAPSQGFWRQL